jgi:hypothetical protein
VPPAGRHPVGPPFFRFSDEQEFGRLLHDAGLEEVRLKTVSFTHREASPASLWDGFMAGTVRTSALILRQTDEMQRRVRAEFDRIVREFEAGGELELPVSVKLASGRKPGG